jgi:hypothetical protein
MALTAPVASILAAAENGTLKVPTAKSQLPEMQDPARFEALGGGRGSWGVDASTFFIILD